MCFSCKMILKIFWCQSFTGPILGTDDFLLTKWPWIGYFGLHLSFVCLISGTAQQHTNTSPKYHFLLGSVIYHFKTPGKKPWHNLYYSFRSLSLSGFWDSFSGSQSACGCGFQYCPSQTSRLWAGPLFGYVYWQESYLPSVIWWNWDLPLFWEVWKGASCWNTWNWWTALDQ